jgi:hypothetical protein
VVALLTPDLHVQEEPDGVFVLAARDVPAWIEAQAVVLDGATANRIYTAARRNAVWTQPLEALASAGAPSDLSTKVWRRWGHDHVYVNDGSGAKVGHLDRKTGRIHVADAARRDEIHAALAPYLS